MLDQVNVDRVNLMKHVVRNSWWFYTAMAALAGVAIVATGYGSALQMAFVIALCSGGMTYFQYARSKAIRLSPADLRGQRAVALSVTVGCVYVACFAAALILNVTGLQSWTVLVVVIAVGSTGVGLWLYDRSLQWANR